jgi:acyl-coenzyme A thioesterase PaaI-like protein
VSSVGDRTGRLVTGRFEVRASIAVPFRPVSEPRDFIDAIRRISRASRIADLDDLDLEHDLATLGAIAERVEAAAVDEPRMQASLTASDIQERFEMALVAGEKGRASRAREVGLAGFFPYSPYIGPLNAMAAPVEFRIVDGDPWHEIHAEHRFDPITNGPPGGVHGGMIAGVFDELLGSVCVLNDVAGFTGTLSIRYRSLTPIEAPISMRGWVDRAEGRKTFARGTFHDGDTLCAEAEGVFIGVEPPG